MPVLSSVQDEYGVAELTHSGVEKISLCITSSEFFHELLLVGNAARHMHIPNGVIQEFLHLLFVACEHPINPSGLKFVDRLVQLG